MIVVPEEIKKILLADTTRKNIRISFPNDSIEDICNDRIVSETFSFTESICSQMDVKFGLCEASAISFECFDVPNIKGKTINAQIEIDITSLGSDFIEQYGQTSDDVNFPFFVIPYGEFKVDSCKRELGALQHRTVQAYSSTAYYDWKPQNEFTKAMLEWNGAGNSLGYVTTSKTNPQRKFKQNAELAVFSEFPELADIFLEKKEIQNGTGRDNVYYQFTRSGVYGSGQNRLYTDVDCKVMQAYKYDNATEYVVNREVWFSKLISYVVERKFDIEAFKNRLYTRLKEFGYWTDAEILNICQRFAEQLYPRVLINNDKNYLNSTLDLKLKRNISKELIYREEDDFSYSSSDSAAYVRIEIPHNIRISLPYQSIDVLNEKICEQSEIHFYKYLTDDITDSIVTTDYVLTTEYDSLSKHYYVYMPDRYPLDLKEVTESFFELYGAFGKYDRTQGLTPRYIKRLGMMFPSNELYPSNDIYPTYYEPGLIADGNLHYRCWFDDEHSKKYQKAFCSYKDIDSKSDEQAEHIIIELSEDDDITMYQSYDLSDNYFIKNFQRKREDVLFILERISEKLKDLYFMPYDAEMIGVPYLEAGDPIEFKTVNGSFYSFIFRRELKGIQALTDTLSGN